MWPSQRLASIGLESGQRKSRARSRDRRGIGPIVTLLEERTLLSTLNLTVTTLLDDPLTHITGQTTLRDAITTVNADTVDSQEVISFTTPPGTIVLAQALPNLANNISINGPGVSNLTVQRDPNAAQFSVFTVNSGVADTISGMTITGGYLAYTGNYYSSFGGGILNRGTLTVNNDTLTNNSAFRGGGIYNDGTLTVANTTFNHNSPIDDNNGAGGGIGGGIYSDIGSTITVDNSTFIGTNTAYSLPYEGIGISNLGTSLVVNNSTFINNMGSIESGISNLDYTTDSHTLSVDNCVFTGNGSGLGAGDDTSTVSNSTFTHNGYRDSSDLNWVNFGGALGVDSTMATVTGCTFTDNAAWGGGALVNSGTLVVSNSTFIGNISNNGGGINNEGTLTVSDSIFTGNIAENGGNGNFSGNISDGGGGIYNTGQGLLINSTLTKNTATNGGGIYNNAKLIVINSTIITNTSGIINTGSGGVLLVNNSIAADNPSYDISGYVQAASKNNLIGDGTGITNLAQLSTSNLIGTTAKPINPLLGPLQNNGGPTRTMALLPGSLAINAGSNALAVDANGNPLTTDQRGAGFPRIVGGTVDIGAFESSGFTVAVTSGSGQSTDPLTAFSSPLVATVTANNPSEPVAGGLVTFAAPPSGASATLSGSPATISATLRR